MKKFILTICLISYSFAIKDILYKPLLLQNSLHNSRILDRTVTNYPESLESNISSDDKNVFLYKGHFRVIFGGIYQDSDSVNSLANNILNIAYNVWQKEIINFGFRQPRNSNRYYIDIYIGNRDAYNKATDETVNISDSYAGYATAYSDGTPYFVINPSISSDILEVTIAHEFFHTVQYAYGLDSVNDDIWYKNVWFLEATAVMMEDEVYTNVNDYINYLSYYFPYTNFTIEKADGGIEYGKVVFAKYLKNRYGMGFIKKLLENYETNETILSDIKQTAIEYNTTFNKLMLGYGSCLANKDSCFTDGSSFPAVKEYAMDENISVDKYGVVLYNEGSDNYLVSSNSEYLQSDFANQTNIKTNINSNGLVFVNAKLNTLNSGIVNYNKWQGLKLKAGWNLVSNIYDENISFSDLGGKIVWVYRDSRYYAFSNDTDLENRIEDKGYSTDDNVLHPNEGAWIYSTGDETVNLDFEKLAKFNLDLQRGWNLITPSSSTFDVDTIDENVTIWNYDNGWNVYSNYQDFNYSKIEKILPAKGYFVYKP
jgi:hypothetical protein